MRKPSILKIAQRWQQTFPFEQIPPFNPEFNPESVSPESAPRIPHYSGTINGQEYWNCINCEKIIVDDDGDIINDSEDIDFKETELLEEQPNNYTFTEEEYTDVIDWGKELINNITNYINHIPKDTYSFLQSDVAFLQSDVESFKERTNLIINNLYYAINERYGTEQSTQLKELSNIGSFYGIYNTSHMLERVETVKSNLSNFINYLKQFIGLTGINRIKRIVFKPMCQSCSESQVYSCLKDDCDFKTHDESDLIYIKYKKFDVYAKRFKFITKSYCKEHATECEICGEGLLNDDDEIKINDEGEYFHHDCYYETYGYCDECSNEVYREDLVYIDDDDGTEVCQNCYNEEREDGIQGLLGEKEIDEVKTIIKGMKSYLPLDMKIIENIIQALIIGSKKFSHQIKLNQKQIDFILKRIQKPEGKKVLIMKSKDLSLEQMLNFFTENLEEAKRLKEEYPKLKGFKPYPVSIKLTGGATGHSGNVISIYPTEDMFEYAEMMQPGAKKAYNDYILHKGHHSGALGYARLSVSNGNIIIDNLQTDIDTQTFKKNDIDAPLRWWVSNIKKFWAPMLLDAMKKIRKATEQKVYITSYNMQKTKWSSLPDRNKDIYDKLPGTMGMHEENINAKPEDLKNQEWSMRRVANNIEEMSNIFYKVAIPLNPEGWESLHSKRIKDIASNKEVIVYHGTSSKKLAMILEHGSIDPSAKSKTFDNSSQGIFVTKEIGGFNGAELYANISAQHEEKGDGSDRVILELIIPLSWIQPDPDDTRYDEQGNVNSLGANQGIISQPIKVSRIRSVMLQGDEIGEIAPSGNSGMFDSNKTEWLPIGVMMKKIKNNPHGLPEEYSTMIQHSKRLSLKEPSIDKEDELAEKLTILHNTFFDPYRRDIREKALEFTLTNSPQSPAKESILKFFNQIGENTEDFTNNFENSQYEPKIGETLSSYLRRI